MNPLGDLQLFYVITPPGFEDAAVSELHEKFPGLNLLNQEKGGFSISAPLSVGFAFNRWLKIPSAVLLRVKEFRVRDFPKLYNQIQSIKWNQYLVGDNFSLSVACKASRLNNEKRVSETVSKGIARFFEKQPPKKTSNKYKIEIQVRVFQDMCTLSINTSGEGLYKRGYKKQAGTAPIRENLAAALFYVVNQEVPDCDVLIDPLCGTGTLLFEAALFYEPNQNRSFAFDQKPEWKEAPIGTLSDPIFNRIQKYYGFDRDDKSLKIAVENKANVRGKKTEVSESSGDKSEVNPRWMIAKRDLFSDEPVSIDGKRKMVLCNPPYGVRIKVNSDLLTYYLDLIKKIVIMDVNAIGIIIPISVATKMPQIVGGLRLRKEIPFENGGIPVTFKIYS